MNERKISTTVYLTERQYSRLKELSEKTRVPVAAYVRQGVELVLKKNEEMLPGQMSLLDIEEE